MEELISEENLQNLIIFEGLLHKSKETMLNEALELYFTEQTKLLEAQQDSQTNLSFEEFWDDFEI